MRYLVLVFLLMSVVIADGQSKPGSGEPRYDVDVFVSADGKHSSTKHIRHAGKNPFSLIKFDKVVMCDFKNKNGKGGMNITAGKPTSDIIIYKQAELNKDEITQLHTRLAQKASFGGSVASCYNAHLVILYYVKDSVVEYISVCMDCGRIYSSIDMPGQSITRVTQEGEEPYYMEDGMSDKFCRYLDGLLKKNSFSHRYQQ